MCDSSISVNKEIIIKDLSKIVNFQFPIVENCPKGRDLVNYNSNGEPTKLENKCQDYNKGICDLNGGYCTRYN